MYGHNACDVYTGIFIEELRSPLVTLVTVTGVMTLLSHMFVQAAGVPTVPGSDGLVRSPDEAFSVAKQVQRAHSLHAIHI